MVGYICSSPLKLREIHAQAAAIEQLPSSSREYESRSRTCKANIECMEDPDIHGMRYCVLPNLKPACLKPTSRGYMYFPITEDWTSAQEEMISMIEAKHFDKTISHLGTAYPLSSARNTTFKSTITPKSPVGKSTYVDHLRICQVHCSNHTWCHGFSIHKNMDTCHLLVFFNCSGVSSHGRRLEQMLDLESSKCTVKSYKGCGSRTFSALHKGWISYVARKADGKYGRWSRCVIDASTGLGFQTRKCDSPRPSLGGKDCTGPSKRECDYEEGRSGFSPWGSCNATCGQGIQTRDCIAPTGKCVGNYKRSCPNLYPCPRWSKWSMCSASCGIGTRHRKCLNGQSCEGNSTEPCDMGPCPQNGGWSEWGECQDGVRRRTCTNPSPKAGGRYCVGDDEIECGEWGEWRRCSVTCIDPSHFLSAPSSSSSSRPETAATLALRLNAGGPSSSGSPAGGVQTRPCLVNNMISDPSLCAGGMASSIRPCPNLPRCARWGAWSQCSATCGEGAQMRICENGIPGSSVGCFGPSTRPCVAKFACPPGRWSPWSKCSKSCGKGHQTRSCLEKDKSMCLGPTKRSCMVEKCNGWGPWSPCSTTCNSEANVGSKTRVCVREDANHTCRGSCHQQCTHLPPCLVDGGYSEWSECSTECGHGWETRTCNNPKPQYGGRGCARLGPAKRRCLGGVCPADGGFSEWAECSKSCGLGTRTRKCDNPTPEFGGKPCQGPTHELCIEQSCHSALSSTTFYFPVDVENRVYLDYPWHDANDEHAVVYDHEEEEEVKEAKPGSNSPSNLSSSFRSIPGPGYQKENIRRSAHDHSGAEYQDHLTSSPGTLKKHLRAASHMNNIRAHLANSLQPMGSSLVDLTTGNQSESYKQPTPTGPTNTNYYSTSSSTGEEKTPPEEKARSTGRSYSIRLTLEHVPQERKPRARFRFVKTGTVTGSYLIKREFPCPNAHDAAPRNGCNLWLGYASGSFILTSNPKKRLRALEAGHNHMYLRYGGGSEHGSWVNLDEDGLFLTSKFEGAETWPIENANTAVAGGYGPWGKCLNGVRRRTCTNPEPKFNGEGCSGPDTIPCSDDGPHNNPLSTKGEYGINSTESQRIVGNIDQPLNDDSTNASPHAAAAAAADISKEDMARNVIECMGTLHSMPVGTILGLSLEEMIIRLKQNILEKHISHSQHSEQSAQRQATEIALHGCKS
eukprot:jgi/Bigna1/73940/fgenesh1_pg.26_\